MLSYFSKYLGLTMNFWFISNGNKSLRKYSYNCKTNQLGNNHRSENAITWFICLLFSEAFICIETIRYLVTQLSFFFLLYSVVWRKEWCFACPSSGSHPFFWLVYLVTFEVLNLGLANTSQKVRCGRVALLMNIVVILDCGVFWMRLKFCWIQKCCKYYKQISNPKLLNLA